jgi:hypothetical protein
VATVLALRQYALVAGKAGARELFWRFDPRGRFNASS